MGSPVRRIAGKETGPAAANDGNDGVREADQLPPRRRGPARRSENDLSRRGGRSIVDDRRFSCLIRLLILGNGLVIMLSVNKWVTRKVERLLRR